MAQRFGIWQRMAHSAYSAQAYRDVAAERLSRMLGYLAALIGMATVCLTLITHLQTGRVLEEIQPWLIESVPEMQITGGKLSSPVDQPYIFESEGFGFVLDTTGQTTELDAVYEQGVLLTETELVYRRPGAGLQRYDLSEFPDMTVDEDTWARWIGAMKSWLWVGVAVTTVLWLWVAKLLQVAFWSLLGLAAAFITKRPLRYATVFNIGIYALTVPLAVEVLASALGWFGGRFGMTSLILYAGYLGWGIFVQPVGVTAPSERTS